MTNEIQILRKKILYRYKMTFFACIHYTANDSGYADDSNDYGYEKLEVQMECELQWFPIWVFRFPIQKEKGFELEFFIL